MLLVTSIDRPNLSLSKDKQNGRLICLEAGAPFQRRIEHGAKGLEEGTHLSWSSPFSDYGMERVTLFTGKSSVTYRSSNSTPKGASCDLASPNCATRGCRLATQRIGIFLHGERRLMDLPRARIARALLVFQDPLDPLTR